MNEDGGKIIRSKQKELNMRWLGTAALAIVFAAGCDKNSDTTIPPSASSSSVNVKSDHPTTQELLTAQRSHLPLQFAPVSLDVPPGWKINSLADGRVVLLEGPTPTGAVSISISAPRNMTAEKIAYLEQGAKGEQATTPDKVKLVDLRPLGSVRVLERQALGDIPTTADATQPATAPASARSMYWTFTLFVPKDDSFYAYELSFIGLTATQFEADKDFLGSIMSSMKYEPQPPLPAR